MTARSPIHGTLALVALTTTACASGTTRGANEGLPPWWPSTLPSALDIRPVSGGPLLQGTRRPRSAAQPAPLGRLTRVFMAPSGTTVVFDDAGSVGIAEYGPKITPLPFGGPVRDVDVLPHFRSSPPGYVEYHAVLASGQIEILRGTYGTEGFDFASSRPAAAISADCIADASTAPVPCYQFMLGPHGPGVADALVQQSSVGPLSRAAFAAMKRVDRHVLAAWQAAGGPLGDEAVRQIDGGDPVPDSNRSDVRPVHLCAVLADHSAACWGTSTYGELGDGERTPKPRFVRVPGLAGVEEIAVGDTHVCARLGDGRVACWGNLTRQNLPIAAAAGATDVPVCPIDRAATDRQYEERRRRELDAVAACNERSCAPGQLDCHLGCVYHDPPREPVYVQRPGCVTPREGAAPQVARVQDRPAFVAGVTDAVSLAAGGARTCVVHATGMLQCWGDG